MMYAAVDFVRSWVILDRSSLMNFELGDCTANKSLEANAGDRRRGRRDRNRERFEISRCKHAFVLNGNALNPKSLVLLKV